MLNALKGSTNRLATWLVLLCCLFVSAMAHAAIPASERAVLLALYASTNGAGWTNKTGWGGAAGTECSWYGVSCNANGSNVTSIGLFGNQSGTTYTGNNLTGSLPDISRLTALQTFYVNNNHLTGPLPSLSGLTALQQFGAWSNQLTGTIPQLSGLTALQNFDVDSNQLTGPIPSLSGLTTLQQFGVWGNQLTGAIPQLSGLTALQTFSVGNNQLTGPIPSLSGLTALKTFSANDNQLTGSIPSLSGLTALQWFVVPRNQLTGIIPSLSGLTALQIFSVRNNQLSGPVPAPSASLPAFSVTANVGAYLCNNNLTSSGNAAIDAAWTTASGSNWLACQNTVAMTTSYQDLWYNPSEPGWGMSLTQHNSTIFVALYAYDAAGLPTWYVMSNCPLLVNSCTGDIYKVTGGTPPDVSWNGSNKTVSSAGAGTLTFTDSNNGTFKFTLNGITGSKNITRQLFGPVAAKPSVDYTDLWWNSNESGWGVSITQQYGTIFVAWYTYDATGKAVWYVASSCPIVGSGCTGDAYDVTGGTAVTAAWNGTNKAVTKVGSVTFAFSDANNGTMSYSINGVTGNRAITRQPFGDVSAANLTTINTAVSMDSSVPQALISKIANIISPAASVVLATTTASATNIAIPSTASGGESMIYAVDASNKILMAALAGSSTTQMSADSTALALTRTLLGVLPSTLTPAQINAAIRATAEYPNLVSQITASFNTGASPTDSIAVFKSLNTVILQIPPANFAKSIIKAANLATPTVATPLPYYLLSPTDTAYQSVYVTSASVTQEKNVNVVNNMSIAWSVASADTSGNTLCSSGVTPTSKNPDCSVLLTSPGVFKQLANLAILNADWATSTAVADNGDAFNLTLEQTPTSKAANLIKVVTDTVQAAITFGTAGTAGALVGNCTNSVVSALLPEDKIAVIVLDPSLSSINNYLASLTNPIGLAGAIAGCAPNNPFKTTANIASFMGATFEMIKDMGNLAVNMANSTALSAANIANLAAEAGFMGRYWNYQKKAVGICEGKDLSGASVITNCATQFQFSPSPVTLAPRSSTTPTIFALDSAGKATLLPPDLTYELLTVSPGVITLDPKTGAVSASQLPAGVQTASGTVNVTDKSTGVTGSYSVTVNAASTSVGNIIQGGLTWSPNRNIVKNWADANAYCMGQGERLPTKDELISLALSNVWASLDSQSAALWSSDFTWSSTPVGTVGHNAVSVAVGMASTYSNNYTAYVTCVRLAAAGGNITQDGLTWSPNGNVIKTWADANAYCAGQGGRLPTTDELVSLYHSGVLNTAQGWMLGITWASAPYFAEPGSHYIVSLDTGTVNRNVDTGTGFVTCVPAAGNIQQGGLTWSPNGNVIKSWTDANTYCVGQGWRLPTKDELINLYNSGILKTAPEWVLDNTWSSTLWALGYYYVNLGNLNIGYDTASGGYYVTCVH